MVEGETVPDGAAEAGPDTTVDDAPVDDTTAVPMAVDNGDCEEEEEEEEDDTEMVDSSAKNETDQEEEEEEEEEETAAVTTTPAGASPALPATGEGEERPNANHDYCDCCNEADGSDVLCCDSCPCSFHLACADPPLTRVPDDEAWFCPACTTLMGAPDGTSGTRAAAARAQAGPLAPLVARVLGMNPVLYSVPPAVAAGAPGDARAGGEHRRRLGRPARRAMECCELPTGDFAQCKICMRRYHIFCLEPPLVTVPLYFECERHVADDTDAPTSAAAVARRALAAGAPYAGNDSLLQDRVKLDRRLPHLPVVLARGPAATAAHIAEADVAAAARALLGAVLDPRPAAVRRAELQAWLDRDAAAAAALAHATGDGEPVAGVYADPQHPFVLTRRNAALVELISQFCAWKDMLRRDCELHRLRKRARLSASGSDSDSENENENENDDDSTALCLTPSRGDTALRVRLLEAAQADLARTLEAEAARAGSSSAGGAHHHRGPPALHAHAHAHTPHSDADSDSGSGGGGGGDGTAPRRGRRSASRRDARPRGGGGGTPQVGAGGVKREREREHEECVIPFRPSHSVPLCAGVAERCPAASAYAHLVYYDPFAEREVILYEMRARAAFVIGRHKASGRPPQVDLKALFGSDHFRNVSHQHCVIEYRARTRTFVVTPLSRAGLYCRIPQPLPRDAKTTLPPLLHINENETHEIKSGTVLYLSSFTLPFRFVVPPAFKPPRGV